MDAVNLALSPYHLLSPALLPPWKPLVDFPIDCNPGFNISAVRPGSPVLAEDPISKT